MKKFFVVFFAVVAGLLLAGSAAAYFYWKSLESSPQYSLALLIDASRRNEPEKIKALVDTDKVTADFVPQIIDEALELYGRGLTPGAAARVRTLSEPLIPLVRERFQDELPGLLSSKTERFKDIPFAALVIGAERYLEIDAEGNEAIVSSRLPEQSFSVKMYRLGDRWQIVAVRDQELASRIARAIGEELIAAAADGTLEKTGESIGIRNAEDLIKEAEKIFRDDTQ